MSCKDCTEKENSYKYLWLERPEKFVIGTDNKPYKEYYFPLGTLYDVENHPPLKQYYSEDEYELFKSDMEEATGLSFSSLGTTNLPFRQTINEILSYIEGRSFNVNIKWGNASLPNPNYGKYLYEDPSFIYWEGLQGTPKQIYEDLEIPTTFLQYNKCGVKKIADIPNEPLVIKGCGTHTIEFRLKLRSLLTFGGVTRNIRYIYGIQDPNDINYTLEGARKQYELYKGLETKSGAKAFGLSEMRYEVGLYNHNNYTYNPIVFSSPNYPQPILTFGKTPTTWVNTREDVLTPDGNIFNLQDPTFGVLPDSPQINEVLYVQSDSSNYTNEYGYALGFLFGGLKPLSYTEDHEIVSDNGVFQNATQIAISEKIDINLMDVGASAVIKKDKIDSKWYSFLNKMDITLPDRPSSMTIDIEYLKDSPCDGESTDWETLTTISYNCTAITNHLYNGYNYYTTFTVEHLNTINKTPLDCDGNPISDLVSQISTTDFYTLDSNYTYRYRITINGYLQNGRVVESYIMPDGSTDDRDNGNPLVLPNYNNLPPDFSSELTGFVEVNLDEGDFSLYVQLKPENNGYDDIGTYQIDSNVLVGSHVVGCNSNIFTTYSNCTPWGELGVDERTSFQKPSVVYYEPLLPIRPELYQTEPFGGFTTPITMGSAQQGLQFIRQGVRPSDFLTMIEESWVRIKKLGEDCCD